MSESKKVKKTTNQHKNTAEKEEDFLPSDLTAHWYIVQTYVGFEDAVRKTLEQKIINLNLQDKIFEIFIPTRKVVKIDSKGQKREKLEKIYPGYIYVKMILDREVGYIIQNTSYVSGIAGTGSIAVPLEESYIDNLKKKLLQESENNSVVTKVNYQVGDLVQVCQGAFKDMRGKICYLDLNKNVVSVSLSIFERETIVDLSIFEIKKIL